MVSGRKDRELIVDVVSIISPSKVSKIHKPEHNIHNMIMRRNFWQMITKVISLSFEIVKKYESKGVD